MMATNGYTSTEFHDIYEDSFYFHGSVNDGDVDEDLFRKSNLCCNYFIRSKDNKFLILNADSNFEVRNLTKYQQHQPGCKFCIQIYHDVMLTSRQARAVMLYTNKDGRKMVVCCGDTNDIYPEPMVDLPNNIQEPAHKAVFYMVEIAESEKVYMFESSMHRTKFLGFECDEDNHGLGKLVLHHKVDQVDETCQMQMT